MDDFIVILKILTTTIINIWGIILCIKMLSTKRPTNIYEYRSNVWFMFGFVFLLSYSLLCITTNEYSVYLYAAFQLLGVSNLYKSEKRYLK